MQPSFLHQAPTDKPLSLILNGEDLLLLHKNAFCNPTTRLQISHILYIVSLTSLIDVDIQRSLAIIWFTYCG